VTGKRRPACLETQPADVDGHSVVIVVIVVDVDAIVVDAGGPLSLGR